jgi:hypothetical protein
MSGLNRRTGYFELTQTKAQYWDRKPVDTSIPFPARSIEYYAEVLRKAGLRVVEVHGAFIEVDAEQGKIWTALSGRPATS